MVRFQATLKTFWAYSKAVAKTYLTIWLKAFLLEILKSYIIAVIT